MLAAVSRKSHHIVELWVATLFIAALVGFWVYATSVPVLRDATTIVTAIGIANSVEEEDGEAGFELNGRSARYVIARPDDEVLGILRASEESGNAVSLHVHLDGARFGYFSNDPEYWVQSVEYLGKSHGKFAARIPWSWRDMGPGDAGLLRGFALEGAWRYEDAVKALDSSLAAGSLGGGRRALAHLTRGSAQESLAYPPGRAINDRDDRLLMRAIGDYRQAAALDNSDHRALLRQGNAARSLGAYDEALALYDEVRRRWPEQYFRAAILRGATYRQIGKLDAALGELDTLVKEHGSQDGMMYHYHRGWTLTELRRYPEAVQEFTAGLQSQPDFAWAFVKRACAYAQQGEIELALADQKRALESWIAVERATRAGDMYRQRTVLEDMIRALELALQSAPSRPNDAPCANAFSGPATERRERSELFEPA